MPDLIHSLHGQDLGHLRIVAELWGVELRSKDVDAASKELMSAIQDPRLVEELIEALDPEARQALADLSRAGGRIPWSVFSRTYGEVREMGAGRRDREKPYLKTASPSEKLFYRALLGRAFFESDDGAQEFAFAPDEWLPVLAEHSSRLERPNVPPGRAAIPAERGLVELATDRILDQATTRLAAIRIGQQLPPDTILDALLNEAGILKQQALQATKAKAFLEAQRSQALRTLVEAWRAGHNFNELRLMPGIICEGEWRNDAHSTRRLLLELLHGVPRQTWWSLDALVRDLKERQPDFQRPAGDYDSWFIRSAGDGHYLRGFMEWDAVDGALIRFLIGEVMHRLGLVDVARPAEGKAVTAFRIPDAAHRRAQQAQSEDGGLHITSQGKITATPRLARAVRYQLARFCEWDPERTDEFRYHISPRALERAAKQGLKVGQLVKLLGSHGEAGIPAPVAKALHRWESEGTEARAEAQTVLRVSRPEMLKALRKSKASKYLGEPLGPTTVIIKGGAIQKVAEAMLELGLLVDDKMDSTA